MSLQNYIRGNRYGKEAHLLEQEAMYDPFLRDAIDGYDLIGEQQVYQLEQLEKQIRKRTRNYTYLLQLLTIVVCCLIIIGLSAFLFMYDVEKNVSENVLVVNTDTPRIRIVREKPPYDEQPSQEIKPVEPPIDTATFIPVNIESGAKTLDQPSIPIIEKKKPMTQIPKKTEYNEDESQDQDLGYTGSNTLSYSELQAIISGYKQKEDLQGTAKSTISATQIISKPTEDLPETTKPAKSTIQNAMPANGEKAYNFYIERNRKKITDSACENQQGKVILIFKVNDKGRPIDIRILRSLCQAADKEAVRLLQNGADWTPNNAVARLEIVF